MFSEMLRLIPPEANIDEEGEYDDNDWEAKEENINGIMTGREGEEEAVSIPDSTNESMIDDVEIPCNGPLASGFSLSELDALLRF